MNIFTKIKKPYIDYKYKLTQNKSKFDLLVRPVDFLFISGFELLRFQQGIKSSLEKAFQAFGFQQSIFFALRLFNII